MSALDGGTWLASCSSRFIAEEIVACSHRIGSSVGPRTGLNSNGQKPLAQCSTGARFGNHWPSVLPEHGLETTVLVFYRSTVWKPLSSVLSEHGLETTGLVFYRSTVWKPLSSVLPEHGLETTGPVFYRGMVRKPLAQCSTGAGFGNHWPSVLPEHGLETTLLVFRTV
jgi:hypothetical protein